MAGRRRARRARRARGRALACAGLALLGGARGAGGAGGKARGRAGGARGGARGGGGGAGDGEQRFSHADFWAAEAKEMFRFAWGAYLAAGGGGGVDEVQPITCRGRNSWGGVALTLVDALPSLVLLGELGPLREGVAWLEGVHLATGAPPNASLPEAEGSWGPGRWRVFSGAPADFVVWKGTSPSARRGALFDRDVRVSVFESNIRLLGGLLSAHALLVGSPGLVPGYGGGLLGLAVDLGNRLLPAFHHSETDIPLAWVNLRRGVLRGETQHTCLAGAGTLLLEMAALSRATGNPEYEERAQAAVDALWKRRSPMGLLGNTLSARSGRWIQREAGIGAGSDSFYEYLLKAWLVLGDAAALDRFVEAYVEASLHMPVQHGKNVFWLDVHMNTGRRSKEWVSSLGAFWPGMQALVGLVGDGEALFRSFANASRRYGGWLPEQFSRDLRAPHPVEKGNPLRPELVESAYHLWAETEDAEYLTYARALQRTLQERNRVKCGFASVRDTKTRELDDSSESFLFSETLMYLNLLQSNATEVRDHFVFTTEGHPLPPLERSLPELPEKWPANCDKLCKPGEPRLWSDSLRQHKEGPHGLRLNKHDAAVLRARRCVACERIVGRLEKARAEDSDDDDDDDDSDSAGGERGDSCGAGGEAECRSRRGGQAAADTLEAWKCRFGVKATGSLESTDALTWEMRCRELSKVRVRVDFQDWVHSLEPGYVAIAKVESPAGRLGRLRISALSGGPAPAACLAEEHREAAIDPPPECAARPLDSEVHYGALALFGGQLPRAESGVALRHRVVLADPEDACVELFNEDELEGHFAVVRRGTCTFQSKAVNAERAGAVGLIVVDYERPSNDTEIVNIEMAGDPDVAEVSLPSILVGLETALALEEVLLEDGLDAVPVGVALDTVARESNPAEPGQEPMHAVYIPQHSPSPELRDAHVDIARLMDLMEAVERLAGPPNLDDLEYSEDGPPAADEDRDWFPPEPPQGEGGDTEGGDYGDYSSDYEASPGSP